MQKTQAIAVMGQRSLLMPGWIKAALQANDHPKLYLSVLQAAAAHAEHPESEVLDLTAELASAHVDTLWLRDMPASASLVDDTLLVPELAVLAQHLTEDLQTMARPLLESETKHRCAPRAYSSLARLACRTTRRTYQRYDRDS